MAKDEILVLVLFLTYLYASGLALLNIVAEAPCTSFFAPVGINRLLANRDPHEEIEEPEDSDNPATAKADGKLVVKEEVAEGHVSLHALNLSRAGLEGKHPVLSWLSFFNFIFGCHNLVSLQSYWVGRWADAYSLPGDVDVIYATYVFGILRAAKKIYALLTDSILGTTLRWLDQKPVSRVITRFTKDIRATAGQLAGESRWFMSVTAQLISQLVAIALIAPAVVFPGIAVFCVGAWFGNIDTKVQLPVKREMSNKKAPVLGHFGAAMASLTSIRAYSVEAAFRKESYKRIKNYTRSDKMYYGFKRWISTRSDALAALFPSGLGVYMVYRPGAAVIGASNVEFSLAMAAAFSNMILVAVNCVSKDSPRVTPRKVPKPSTTYRSPPLGIVGRTGSGKSSLALSLLRCIYSERDVYHDGVNTADLNLDVLRTNVTIIPQVPELLSGTLRENLDPFSEHLNSALRASGLFSLQSETGDVRAALRLTRRSGAGGGNLSVGQRQTLALARALTAFDVGRIVEYDSPKVLLKKDGGFLKSLVDEVEDKDALYAMAGEVVDAI
ncbi:unnamed protein product [Peniophora sp. CBMAI 1063]|nr:unnamed protein product [Peniophora sp. CBMAI 1063]